MLTNKARYGLRAMCALAECAPGSAQARILSRKAHVPEKFLEAILVELRQAGFISSRRGQMGGHALARPAAEIMVGDVIRALDGPLAPVRCASMTDFALCTDCRDPETCAIRGLMREVRTALSSVLDQCSLQALAERSGRASEIPLLSGEPA